MAHSRISAAVGALLLVSGAASACDDFDEEMAVQAARSAAKLEQARTDSGQEAAVVAASAPQPSQPTEVAAAEPDAAPAPTTSAEMPQKQ
jgi:hypothetical protein